MTLSWVVTGTMSAAVDQGAPVPTGNQVVVTPLATTVYTLTASNGTQQTTATLTVHVTPKIVSFTASPDPVDPGQSTTLHFDVQGASVSSAALDQGLGNVLGQTSLSTGPLSESRTFTLSATNSAGTVTRSVTAHVRVHVDVAPATGPVLLPEQARACAAVVTGTSNPQVTWSLQEGALAGAIDASGLYTAGWTSGTYHVVATSAADPTASGQATVTVQRPPTGTLDVTFGDGGVVLGPVGTFGAALYTTPTRVFMAGSSFQGGGLNAFVVELDSSGQFVDELGPDGGYFNSKRLEGAAFTNDAMWVGGYYGGLPQFELHDSTGVMTLGYTSAVTIPHNYSFCMLGGAQLFVGGNDLAGTSSLYEVGPGLASPTHTFAGTAGASSVACAWADSNSAYSALYTNGGIGLELIDLQTGLISQATVAKTVGLPGLANVIPGPQVSDHRLVWVTGIPEVTSPCIEEYEDHQTAPNTQDRLRYSTSRCFPSVGAAAFQDALFIPDAATPSTSGVWLLLAGNELPNAGNLRLVEVDISGQLISTFGNGGILDVSVFPNLVIQDLYRADDGKLLAAGLVGTSASDLRWLVARLWP